MANHPSSIQPQGQQAHQGGNYRTPTAPSAPAAQYAQTVPAGAPVAVPPPIETNRNLPVYILLTIVTCGIYGYYYIYKLAQDVNRVCVDGDKVGGLAAYIILSFITFGFYSYYWEYRIANKLQENAPLYGLNFTEGGMTVLLWDIVGLLLCFLGPFVATHIIMKNMNAIAVVYNSRIV